jgi:hypothetical protein
MKNLIKLSFALLLTLSIQTAVFAQPDFDDDVEDTPIDGGIGLLVGAGIAYGIKKAYNLKKEKEQDA